MKKYNNAFKFIKYSIVYIFKFSWLSIVFIPKLLIKFFKYISKKLHFSITFKITTFYALIFALFILISNIIMVSGFYFSIWRNVASSTAKNGYLYVKFTSETIEINHYSFILFLVILCADLLFLILILLLGSKLSKKLLLPVKKMDEAVKKISGENLNTRLDISGSKDELKDLAQTFNEMLDRIQSTYESQTQFVSDASHELRTPISVIQGYANLLDRWGKNDKEILEEAITSIKCEAEDMKDLVEKLLFLARSDKNTQKIEKSKFLFSDVIDEVFKATLLIDEKHSILMNRNDKVFFYGDRQLIKEALRVFIDNSVKYTTDGGIIEINSYNINNEINIEIRDTGIGISKEDLSHVFDRFYRADKSRTRNTGGTGLGLSIAKWIIDKHNGHIKLESQIGKGTKVTIILSAALN